MPQSVEAAPRLDAQAREVMKRRLGKPKPELVGWPVARRFKSGAPTCIRVTGHMAVAQPSWRGTPRCSARPPVFMELSDQLRVACCPPKGTLAYCNQGRGPAEAFLL
jgi:hypothetical protein